MTTYVANLGVLTLTTAEKNAVASAVGYEDAQGMISAVNCSLQETIIQLTRLAGIIPAGSNLTAINNVLTLLQS
ncbi:hypothetical protein [Herbaspirillum frisingense]|uniref:hypothetical protein n=1 Tax=Herbaspirillum frisingense TaxID=92645 RepID=UPI0039B04D32